ncbi:hypothetical protein DdX_22103 [Ditylenchus destructor]|uniref:Uncharacterized protein n=1 Tax=Ditylenchus destructor TaxID=166010 RepID=A0AAD4MG91_9BILA|nr:hypothetical protein DdX_22103 [Ditylenchus destructor]
MDNGTMVEAFKFLNYYQLATNSFVSKRFPYLIRTHRHKLALLYWINRYVGDQDPAVIKIFNEELSPDEYNEWIVRNGYSKQIPLEGQIAGKESSENDRDIYWLQAHAYQNPYNCHDIATTVFFAEVQLTDDNWPLFQHFFRLLMDPYIYIRSLSLYSLKSVLSLLTGAMNPDHNRLQCEKLNIRFNDDTQKFIVWIKDHVRCDEFEIDDGNEIYFDSDSNCDEEFLDLFLTGAPCTSSINAINYDLSKVIFDFVQKFIGFKSRDEYQLVESIRGDRLGRRFLEELKRNCIEFVAEEKQYEMCYNDCYKEVTRYIIRFINHDIEKKLTFNVKKISYIVPSFSIKITNL